MPLTRLESDADLVRALEALSTQDTDIAREFARIGAPTLRRWPRGFETLLDVILGQQLSVTAARTIRDRMKALVGEVTPKAILAASEEALRGCGFSGAKVRYARALAEGCDSGAVQLDALEEMPDDDALAHLVAVKGIGAWTAEVYLLFAHGRIDLWPADDIAVMEALRHLRSWEERPTGKARRLGGEPFAPYRGAAAHFLWHLYRNRTDRDAVVIEA